jgi:hypothetical protein
MMIAMRMHLILFKFFLIATLVLPAPMAIAQNAGSNKQESCKLFTAKRGGSAELVPDGSFSPDQALFFPYLISEDRLLEGFRVEHDKDDRRKGCLAAFGIQSAAGQSGTSTAVASGAANPVAVGAVGAGFGIGTMSAGVAAAAAGGLLFVVVAGTVIGVVSADGNAGNGPPTTCTTC